MRKVKWGKKHVKMSAGQDQSSEYIFEKEGSFDDKRQEAKHQKKRLHQVCSNGRNPGKVCREDD